MPILSELPRRPSVWSVRPRTSLGLPNASTDSALPTLSSTGSQRRLTQDFTAASSEFLGYRREQSQSDILESAEGEEEWIHVQGDSRIKRSLDHAASGVRTLVRRASNSMQRLHNRPSKSRKGSRDTTAETASYQQFSYPEEESGTVQSAPRQEKSSSSLRRAFSRRDRRAGLKLQSDQNVCVSSIEVASPATSQLCEPGASARAAAAAHNAAMTQNPTWKKRLLEINRNERFGSPGYADSCADSDMDVCTSPSAEPRDHLKASNPVTILPTEIASLVFSFLDAKSLAAAEQVCPQWHAVASSQHVWREVFLRKYEPRTYVSPAPLQMGGGGAGGAIRPGKDWKKMYKARVQIERNWTASTPKAVYFSGHTDSVYCCQFDEDKIITGSRDRTIRVWDLHTYRCLKVIGGPANRPVLPPAESQPLDTHPTATISAIPSINGTDEGNNIYHIPSEYHSASILCLQFDTEILVTGSSDSTCIVWDINTYEPIRRLRHHTAGVLDVCFDAKYIISCSKDATICVWDRKTGDLIRTLQGHRGPVNAVQLRGNLLVSASGDGISKLWNLERMTCIRDFQSRDRGLAAVEFSDDARYVLAGGNDHVIYKFDANTGTIVHTFKGHTQLVRSLFLDSSNSRVLSGSYDQGMRVFDFNSGKEISRYDNWTTSWILAAKSDYRRIVATSQDGRALLMDFGLEVENADMLDGRDRA